MYTKTIDERNIIAVNMWGATSCVLQTSRQGCGWQFEHDLSDVYAEGLS